MNGYNFTERVRTVLAFSRDEASALHHEYVGTEHILLGILREGESVACAVLSGLHIDPDGVRHNLLQQVKRGKPGHDTGPDLPYTSRAKKVLELAMSEARDLGHSYVGCEHLLLGLLREERGIAAQVLADRGLTLARARAETLEILGSPDSTARANHNAREPGASDRSAPALKVSSVFVEMHFENGSTVRKEFVNAAAAIRYLENR